MELGGSGSESADDLGEANRQLEQLRQQRGLGSEQHGFVARNLGSALDILASQLNSKTTHFILELIQNADDNAYPSGVQPTFSLVLDKNGSNFTLRTDCNETGFSLKNIDAICSIGKSTKTGIINGQKGFIGEKGIGFKSVFKVAHQVDILSNFYEFRIDRTAHLGMLDPKPHRFPDTQRREGHTQMLLHLLRDKDHRISDITKGLQQIKPELLLFLRQLSVLDIKVEDGHCVYRSIRQNRDPRYDGETVSLNEDRTGSPFDEPVKTTKLHLIVRYEVQDMPVDARRNSVSSTEITLALPVGSELETCDAFAFLPIDQSGFNFIVQADFLLVANRQALQHALPWNQRILEAIPDAFVQAVRHFNHADATHGYSLKYKWPLFLEYNGPKSSTWTEVHQGIKRRLCDEDVLEARDGRFRAVRPVPCPAGTQQTAAHKPLIIIPTEYRFDNGFLIDATINHGHHLAFEYDPVLEELKALDVKEMTGAGLRNEFSDWLERAGHAGLAAKSDKWHAALAAAFMWKGRSKQKDKLQELPLVHLADGSWAACAGGDIFFPSTGAVLNVPSDLGIRVVHSNAAKDPHRREFYTYLGVKKLDAETICSLILEKHAMIPRPTRKPLNWVLDILFLFRQKKLLATMDKKPRWFLVAGNRSIAEHVYVEDPSSHCPLLSRLIADPSSEIQTPSSDLMDEFTGNTKYEFISWLQQLPGVSSRPRLVHKGCLTREWLVLSQNAGNELLIYLKNMYKNDQEFFSHMGEIGAAMGNIRVQLMNGQRIAQRPAYAVTQESVNEFYRKLSISARDFQPQIRTAFAQQPLIFISGPNPQWAYPTDCIWRRPDYVETGLPLPKVYEGYTGLFRDYLEVRSINTGDISREIKAIAQNGGSIDKVKHLVRDLLALLPHGRLAEAEEQDRDEIEGAPLFPVKTYRPELEKMFIGKVELLDVEASLRRSLVGAFGLHLRQLSKAVTEEVTWNNRGQTIDRNMTTSFRSRAAQFCRYDSMSFSILRFTLLVRLTWLRLSSNPTAEMLDRLKKTEVKTVSCINITRKLDGCAPIRDASRRHHVQELDDRIVIYHTTLTETDVMHLEDDFSGIVVRTCGIDDARWSRLVPFIMRVDPDQIMDFLDKHDVRDNNGPAFDMVDEWEQTKSENGQSEKEQGDQVIESGPAENAMDVGDGPDDLDLGGISFEDNDAGLYDDGDSEGVAPAKPDVLKKATEAAEIKLEETARHCPGTGPSSSPPTSNPTPLKNVRRRSRVEESSHTRKRQRVEKMTTPPSVDKISDDADGHDDMAIDDADKLLSEPTIEADVPPIPHEPNYPEVRKNVEALLSELLPGWQPYGDEMPDCYRYVDDGDETMLKFAKRFHLRADSFKHIAPQMKAGTTYCLDVKMTAGEVSTPFGLNKTQNHFHHKRDNTTNIIYLVLRVSHALHDIQGLLVILNPWTRRVDENDRTELQCSEWTVFNFE
ncbi:heterokaryon incompatibility [Verticillium dahliae]